MNIPKSVYTPADVRSAEEQHLLVMYLENAYGNPDRRPWGPAPEKTLVSGFAGRLVFDGDLYGSIGSHGVRFIVTRLLCQTDLMLDALIIAKQNDYHFSDKNGIIRLADWGRGWQWKMIAFPTIFVMKMTDFPATMMLPPELHAAVENPVAFRAYQALAGGE